LPAGQPEAANMSIKQREEIVVETVRKAAPPPPLYRVLLLNDDYTPMEYVVSVLEHFFSMRHEQAIEVMLKVHNEGAGIAGLYPRDVAETKVHLVTRDARNHQHPLQCVMEENR
jgi:ATP-dependent Clp protease adaptor protein ClpS